MRVPLAVLADYANVTADGKLNIMGIFNQINAAAVPVVHPQMQLVFVMESDPQERGQTKQMEVHLLDPDGKTLLRIGAPVQIPEDAPLTARFNQMIQLNLVRFERYGDHSFRISVGGQEQQAIAFQVNQVAPPQPLAALPPPA